LPPPVAAGEPNDSGGNEPCVQVGQAPRKMNDLSCTATAADTSLAACCQAPAYAPATSSLSTGILQNIAISTVTSAGYSQCYSDAYSNSGTPLSTIFSTQCTGNPLLWACMATGSSALTLAAWGDRNILLTDVGSLANPQSQITNGVNFYYSSSYSMGFVQQGESLSRNSCDTVRRRGDELA